MYQLGEFNLASPLCGGWVAFLTGDPLLCINLGEFNLVSPLCGGCGRYSDVYFSSLDQLKVCPIVQKSHWIQALILWSAVP